MPVTRSQSAIDQFKEATQVLDQDGNGVEKEEFYQGLSSIQPAIREFTGGEFHIVTYDYFVYWTEHYRPNTQVSFWAPHLSIDEMEGFDIGQELETAYEDGQLLDMALVIENEERIDESLAALEALEEEWLDFSAAQQSQRENASKESLASRLVAYCEAEPWAKSQYDPDTFFDPKNFSEQELIELNVLADFIDFVHAEKGFTYLPDASTQQLLLDGLWDCNIISTAAVHMFKLLGINGFEALIIPFHATLIYQSTGGHQVYFNNANWFLPPDYYDLPKEDIGRARKIDGSKPIKPWEILSANMVENTIRRVSSPTEKIQAYEMSLQINPGYLGLNNAIGDMLTSYGSPAKALPYLQKEVESSPNDIEAHNNLGYVYLLLQEYQDALDTFLRAETLAQASNKRSYLTSVGLATTYTVLGQTDQAESYVIHEPALGVFEQVYVGPVQMYLDLAKNFVQLGFDGPAIQYYQLAIQELPDSDDYDHGRASAYSGLANAYYVKGDFESAESNALVALSIDASNTLSLDILAGVYVSQGDLEKSKTYYEKILEIEPEKYNVVSSLALVYYHQGDYDTAKGLLQQSYDLNPYYFYTVFYLGTIEFDQGNFDAASRYFQETLQLNPNNPDALFYLGLVNKYSGNLDQAQEYFEKVDDLSPDQTTYKLQLAEIHVQRGDREAALGLLLDAYRIDPQDTSVLTSLGYFYEYQGEDEKAKSYYQAALTVNPTDLSSQLNYGNFLFAQGDIDGAIDQVEASLETYPQAPGALLFLAVFYKYKNDMERVRELLDEVLSIDPNYTEAHALYASVYSYFGEDAQAQEHFEHAQSISPDNAISIYLQSDHLIQRGDFDQAESLLVGLLDVSPKDIFALTRMALSKYLQGHFVEADQFLNRAFEVNPKHGQALSLKTDLQASRGDLDGALAIAQDGLIRNVDDVNIMLALAYAHKENGDFQAAKDTASQLLAIRPNDVETLVLQAEISALEGGYQDAEHFAQTALAFNPKSTNALNVLFAVSVVQKQKGQAEQYLAEIQSTNLSSAYAYVILGNLYTQHGNKRKAVKAFERALAIDPDQPHALTKLAQVYAKMGKTKKATEVHEQLLVIDPQSRVVI